MKTLTRLLVPAMAASIALIAVSCGARAKQGYGSYETAASGPMAKAKRSSDMDYFSDMDGISDEAEYYAPMEPSPGEAGDYWMDEIGYSLAPASAGGGTGGGPGPMAM